MRVNGLFFQLKFINKSKLRKNGIDDGCFHFVFMFISNCSTENRPPMQCDLMEIQSMVLLSKTLILLHLAMVPPAEIPNCLLDRRCSPSMQRNQQ